MTPPRAAPRHTREHDDLLALFDREQRKQVTYPGFRREVLTDVVRMTPIKPPYDEGAVIYSRLQEATADATIAAQIAYFETLGYGFEWKTYGHDTPDDLPDRLLRLGFEAEEPESVMVMDLVEASELVERSPVEGVRLLTNPDDIREVVFVLARVWGEEDAWLGPVLASEMAETPDLLRIYVAYVNGVPASTAWIRYHPDSSFASLWGGSTVPDHRGRGLYRALLSARARDAHGRGVRYLTVDASPMSRPILERLGFRLLTVTRPFKWTSRPRS
jgi:GNAT superfamily N-acetyltransferase